MEYSNLLIPGVLLFLGVGIGYIVRHTVGAQSVRSAEQKLKTQLDSAKNEAREIVLEAKDKASAVLEESKKEERERMGQVTRLEERLLKKEESLEHERKATLAREEDLVKELHRVEQAKEALSSAQLAVTERLSHLAGLSRDDARAQLFRELEDQHRVDLAKAIQKQEREIRDTAEKRGMEIITTAVQRYARSHVSDITTSVFQLPSEDLKGKIIGREGRNIRALERATGAEFVIDEVPDAIVISSFDPARREVARLTLEKLVQDGRIQPAKIEEKTEESRNELNKRMLEIGEAAAQELGIYDLPKEICQLVGRLHFRTSFGQNVLTHSIEMAYISAAIAEELGADVEIARKGALLHDIGKAIDHDVEGTHVELGRKILKKYGIDERVIRAMESHHEDYPFSTPESYIVTAADVLSAARPGARRGTVENYIKRLADLEKIASEFPGVKTAYAISAGRELRVFVVPEQIDDFGALQLAKNIATKVESNLKYPGEIKVNVIREMRAVEFAR